MKQSLGLISIALSLLVVGCGTDDGSSTGTLELPLSLATIDGDVYTLDPARVRVQSTTDNFQETFDVSESDVFRVGLLPGEYEVELLSDWVLNENDSPIAEPVILESANPVPFSIEAGATTPVTFHFGIGDKSIALGDGQLEVGIQVTDRTVLCPCWDGSSTAADCGGRACESLEDLLATVRSSTDCIAVDLCVDIQQVEEELDSFFATCDSQDEGGFHVAAGVRAGFSSCSALTIDSLGAESRLHVILDDMRAGLCVADLRRVLIPAPSGKPYTEDFPGLTQADPCGLSNGSTL
jgi:hypothetical protein